MLQNVIAILFLLVALLVVAGFVSIFFMPDLLDQTPLAGLVRTDKVTDSDLPTPAGVAVVPSLTPTMTPNALLPTWTPKAEEPTPEPLPTNTLRPTLEPSVTPTIPTKTPTPTATNTPTSTPTETPIGPTATSSPTRSSFLFTKSNSSPFYLQNFANNAGCDWMGIAGEVLDLNRNPVEKGSYRVHVWGSGIDNRLTVGTAPAYSPSGWEQFLFDSPVVRDYNVQLETNNGTAVSQVYSVQSRASCNQNLVRFDFVQNHQ
ncbi:MAG: hypothetical protein P8183_01475 [Anaerolineae bacterium]